MLEDTGVDRYDDLDDKYNSMTGDYDAENHLFPYCVVWTPIPFITWFFPFIGHMGIGTSRGIIRDFAGSYYVSENNMGFGWPTMYWQLSPLKVIGGPDVFDRAVRDASDEYKSRMHNLFCDNCHSHVANALNRMAYNNRKNYNMVNLCFMMMYHGKYVGWSGVIKQWLPMAILLLCIFGVVMFARFG